MRNRLEEKYRASDPVGQDYGMLRVVFEDKILIML